MKRGAIAWAALTVCLLGLGALAYTNHSPTYTPPPGLSVDDTAFLIAIHDHGLTNKAGDTAIINTAHDICNLLRQGQTVEGLGQHYGLTVTKMTADDTKFYVTTAAATYCPQYIR